VFDFLVFDGYLEYFIMLTMTAIMFRLYVDMVKAPCVRGSVHYLEK